MVYRHKLKALGSKALVATLIGLGGLGACTTSPNGPGTYVTVKYDPNDYDQSNLKQLATAQCQAKGFSHAGPSSVQPSMDAANWSYQSFGCY
ncbi:MAG: hypothetical protein AAF986_03650 [Pseudomonadota bacterium]